ncbi:MAG: 3'-5' exonuclease [Oscillospiraceae bacterium]|nr:3'-5' exonuclease [Oscillospiraceae bacterium]
MNKSSSLFCTHNPIILFDVETTGLSSDVDDLIELGAIILSLNQKNTIAKEELNCLIKLPEGKHLSAEISKLTGITNEMLETQGLTQQDAANTFVDMIEQSSPDRILFIAHNAHFDISFLNAFLRKNGHSNLADQFDILDTLTILKDRKSYPHKLSDAITHYKLNEQVENNHRALDDVKALFAVLSAMAKETGDLPKYINLLGYNPRYGAPSNRIPHAVYVPQSYNSPTKLYANT